MSNFFDALTGKSDGKFTRPAVELSGAGGSIGNMPEDPEEKKGRKFFAADAKNSSAAQLARERAAAAKAQIEYRKQMEEERKAKEAAAKAEEENKESAVVVQNTRTVRSFQEATSGIRVPNPTPQGRPGTIVRNNEM